MKNWKNLKIIKMIKIKDIAYNKESKTHHKLFFLAEFLERKKEEER